MKLKEFRTNLVLEGYIKSQLVNLILTHLDLISAVHYVKLKFNCASSLEDSFKQKNGPSYIKLL